MPLIERVQIYYRQPGVTFVPLGLPPVSSALVSRQPDRRSMLFDFEKIALALAEERTHQRTEPPWGLERKVARFVWIRFSIL